MALPPEDDEPIVEPGAPLVVDGTSQPCHARGVSARTPEIITLFDYLPLFNNSNPPVLSRGGKLFDINVNARRIRIQQLYDLLEELSKDPDSETAKIVEQLKADMITEMKKAKNNFLLYRSIYNSFFGFLTSFDLKQSEEQVLQIMQSIRDERNGRNDPILFNSTISSVSTFSDILIQNHGFNSRLVNLGSNTKLLYYIMHDLRRMFYEAGPDFTLRLQSQRNSISSDSFNFTENPSLPSRNQGFTKIFFPARENVNQNTIYHRGRLGLSIHAQNENFAGNRFDLGESLGFYETEEEVGIIRGANPRAVSMLLITAMRDMAISSGINFPNYQNLGFSDQPERVLIG